VANPAVNCDAHHVDKGIWETTKYSPFTYSMGLASETLRIDTDGLDGQQMETAFAVVIGVSVCVRPSVVAVQNLRHSN
jgi:hypothetical protein